MLARLISSLQQEILGNPLSGWVIASLVALGTFLVALAVRGFASRRLRLRAERRAASDALLADAIASTRGVFVALVAVVAATQL